MSDSDKMGQLIDAGFVHVGHWELDPDQGIRFAGELPMEPGIYAFTVDRKVCYVGSTQRGLGRRFRKYRNAENKGGVAVSEHVSPARLTMAPM